MFRKQSRGVTAQPGAAEGRSEPALQDSNGFKWPRITIVTPCFNRAEFFEEAIQSVLSQNYPNLEYIIFDGGSSNPEMFDIIRRYEDRLAWWASEPDEGHGFA